ncbi:MAG TPA: YceI family protein [Thermoanaerobaculia bacterium]|nr:YceI family protein [Thermoanaerobaculia bacterium]
MKHFKVALVAALLAATPLFAADTFKVDKSHSSADFKIRHMMSNVTGRFSDFDATIALDRGNPAASSVEFTINAASIDTANENRDKHLRSADFFEVEKYPAITFKSTKITPAGKDRFDVTGNLTMHGVTKEVTLPVTFLGFGKDPWGNERAGFEIETTLNRKDYGLNWNKALDQGGVLLADDVKVSIALEAVKQK